MVQATTEQEGGSNGSPKQFTGRDNDDVFALPSGADISLRRPDFRACRSIEDFIEIKCALQEKIIDIELQIELFQSGIGIEQGRSYERDWLPRANAALKWTKLYRSEAEQRHGLFSDNLKAQRSSVFERRFVDVARAQLAEQEFTRLCDLANYSAPRGVCFGDRTDEPASSAVSMKQTS